ncbi:MAG: hypothetical protein E4H35_00995 [Candidatus Aminicenantes bacterium]|nr:MAG: hypothetical protein E4H35_00995 [Candidatus Aminicenantes bacterium]
MTKFYRNASMVILLALLASGCLAPLSNNFTARSLGPGKIGLDGGMLVFVRQEGSVALPAFTVAVGLSSGFDLGVQMESASIGVFGKYSFINNKERGFSLAGVLGAGAVASGSYAYAGPVLSYKSKAVEPYFVGRFNRVHYGESDDIFEDWEPGTYTYVQFTLGSIFWLNQSVGLNVEGSALVGNLGKADFEDFSVTSFVVLVGTKVRF